MEAIGQPFVHISRFPLAAELCAEAAGRATAGLHLENSSIDKDSTRRIDATRHLDVDPEFWGELSDEPAVDCDEQPIFVQKCQFIGGTASGRNPAIQSTRSVYSSPSNGYRHLSSVFGPFARPRVVEGRTATASRTYPVVAGSRFVPSGASRTKLGGTDT
jgi:hypothetical protein